MAAAFPLNPGVQSTGGGVYAGPAIVSAANPSTPTLYDAPFRPGEGERLVYMDAAAGVAIMPLALRRGRSLEIQVTTPGETDKTR